MNKEEILTQRKPSLKMRVKQWLFNLAWGWRTRNIWDMSKHQSCPKCHGLKPRTGKLVGASYHCNKCKQDFVVWKRVVFK